MKCTNHSSKTFCIGALRGLHRLYKRFLSPLFGNSCRFTPQCSDYGVEAIESLGWWRGAVLTCWRLLRCHPWCKGGDDPVPNEFMRRKGFPGVDRITKEADGR